METLHNIWTVLTTENEKLTILITDPLTFIEVWISFLFITAFLKLNYTKYQKILYIILISVTSLVMEYIIPAPFNVFINYIVMFIVIKLIFKMNYIKTFLAIILPSVVFALIIALISNPMIKILNVPLRTLNNTPLYRLLCLLITYSIAYILVCLLKHMTKINFTLIDNLSKENKRIILLNLALGLITVCTQSILVYFYINTLPIFITLLNFPVRLYICFSVLP